jgi:hypothetical protein
MIEERLKFDPKYPEMQLAHEVKDPNGRAYNRTAFIDDRREMMQEWADYLDELRLSVASKLETVAPLDDRRLAAV